MPYDFNNTEYWFDRAKELRTRVDLMRDRGNREIMLRIADDYERLGRRAAERREREETPLKSRKPRWTAGNHRRVACWNAWLTFSISPAAPSAASPASQHIVTK